MTEWILGGASVLGILTVAGFAIKMNIDNSESRKRIYERLDEVKGKAECTFVRKDLCDVVHDAVNKNLDRIDRSMLDGFRELNQKIDKIMEKNGIKNH